jgi:outer membrane protein assembly factor BamB
VRVVVLDGDIRKRVPGATVRIGDTRLRANRSGIAAVRLVPRPALVRVTAPGYSAVTQRVNFRRKRSFIFRVYQPRLQWTMYGGDPAHSGVHSGPRLRPPFRIVWSLAHGDLIEFPAVVSDGVAYVANGRGTIRAFSMRNGALAWQHATGTIMASSLAVWGDKLVAHGMGDGRVRVLDRRTGRLLWSRRVGSGIESSPVIRYGIDYFGTRGGSVYGLNLRTNKVRWVYRSGAKITASVSLAGRTAYLGNYAGQVMALSTRTGRPRWTSSVNGRVYGTAPVADGRVFVPSSTGGSVTALSTRGRRLWRFSAGSYVYSSPVTWGGRVVFGSYNGVLYCVSRSGVLRWRARVGGAISGAPVIVDGVAYAASFGDRTVGVDVRTGRVIFRFPHGRYVPVSGNGGRLLLHGYSRIWAVDPRRR